MTKSVSLRITSLSLLLMLTCSAMAQWPTSSVNYYDTSFLKPLKILPWGFEFQRFSLETGYGVDNNFTDVGWPGGGSTTSYQLDAEMNVHLGHAIAMERLHSKRYYRHVKTNAFIRVPFCEDGVLLDTVSSHWETPNPNSLLGASGGYFSYALYNGSSQCREGSDYGSAFLRPIVAQAHQRHHTIGEYIQIQHDFFIEAQLPTHYIAAGDSSLGLATPISPSLSLCRILENYDSLLTYPNGLTISEYDNYDNNIEISNYKIIIGFDIDTIGIDSLVIDTIWAVSHYLCQESPQTETTNMRRCRTMSRNNADYICFDTRYAPERGCFCVWHRMRYATLYSGDSPDSTVTDNWDLFVKKYVAYDDSDGGLQGEFKPAQNRRLHDFMNVTQKEAFQVYLDTMHYYGPKPYGTLGVVSVQDLGALNMEDYRTDFANLVDVPKTEWFTPIKEANNFVFFGDTYTNIPKPCPEQAGIMCGDTACNTCATCGVCNPLNYKSILTEYHIPEDIRTAGAFSLLRDVSKYSRTFLWLSPVYLRNKPINHSVRNNQRLQTFLGYGYVLGGMPSTTIGNFYKIDTTATDSIRLYEGFNNLWDFVNETNANSIDSINPVGNQISNIFDADAAMSSCLVGLKPVPYASVLYSEEELKRWHYINNGSQFDSASAVLPTSLAAPSQTSNRPALRQALVWWNNLLPMYGGFNALYNSLPLKDGLGGKISFKIPTQFVADWQLNKDLDESIALLIPVPIYADDSLSNTPFESLTDTTQAALAALPNPKIPIFRDSLWYKKGKDGANGTLQYHVRQSVKNAIGLPDIYVTGHSDNAHLTHAGFYTDPKHTRVAVPLVIEPMYAIPRTQYVKVTGEPWQLLPNESLDLATTPDTAYDYAPKSVTQGDLIIHIKKGSNAMFDAANTSDYTATAVFSDMVTYQGQPVPLTVTESPNEYLIKVPAFTCTIVVCIDINQ